MVLGIWGIGLATRSADLTKAPIIESAWMLHHDGRVLSNGEEIGTIDVELDEGDNIVSEIKLKKYNAEI